jgi:hypothetical protein
MCFFFDGENRDRRIAIENIPVFIKLNGGLKDNEYKVGILEPQVRLIAGERTIEEGGYCSQRAPEPDYYPFVIPKGSEYYYTTNESLQYISNTIMPVSDKPLTQKECLEICNFPKTYGEACERLGINPLNESKLIKYGLNAADIALKKLQTVIKCINRQYGIEKYDWERCMQAKWYGSFEYNNIFQYTNAYFRSTQMGACCSSSLCLPFEFAVTYVCSLNMEFFEYWKSYVGVIK